MSIIYDALKKVEKAVSRAQPVATPASAAAPLPVAAPAAPVAQSPKGKQVFFFVMLAVFVIIGSLVVYLVLDVITGRSGVRENPAAERAVVVSPRPAVPALMPSAAPVPPSAAVSLPAAIPPSLIPPKPANLELVVNGVFFSDGEGYALVNNMVVREGERIGEVTLKKISIDGVEVLTGDGQLMRLSVKK